VVWRLVGLKPDGSGGLVAILWERDWRPFPRPLGSCVMEVPLSDIPTEQLFTLLAELVSPEVATLS
jgi:hypothetical protein